MGIAKSILCQTGLSRVFNSWHPGTLTLSHERQSARMPKITNDVRLNPVWHRMLYSCTHTTTVIMMSRLTHGGLWQVHGLEDETHDGRHLDHLPTHQTQLLVVVEHRVHVLDPHGVDWSVKHHPLPVRSRQRRVLTERVCRYTVRPLHNTTLIPYFIAGQVF